MKLSYPAGHAEKMVFGKDKLSDRLVLPGSRAPVQKRNIVSADGKTRIHIASTPGGRLVNVDVKEESGSYRLFLLNENAATLFRVFVIDPAKDYEVTAIELPKPGSTPAPLAAAAFGDVGYVLVRNSADSYLYRVDLAGGEYLSHRQITLTDTAVEMTISRDGARILVAHAVSDTVKAYDSETLEEVGSGAGGFDFGGFGELFVELDDGVEGNEGVLLHGAQDTVSPFLLKRDRISLPSLSLISTTTGSNDVDVVRAQFDNRTYVSSLGLDDGTLTYIDNQILVYEGGIHIATIPNVYYGKFFISPDGRLGYFIPCDGQFEPGPGSNTCALQEIDLETFEITQNLLPYDHELAPNGTRDFYLVDSTSLV